MNEFKCKIDGCMARFHKAKGYCARHYGMSRYEPVKLANRPPAPSLCEFEGEHSNAMAIAQLDGKACCTKHYAEGMGLIAVKTPTD